MNTSVYKSHKQILILYYILFYWVVVKILAPIDPPTRHPQRHHRPQTRCKGKDIALFSYLVKPII